MFAHTAVLLALCGAAVADLVPRQTAAPTASEAAPEITAVTACHAHGTDLYCMAGDDEYRVATTLTQTTDVPESFTGCHSHDAELFCVDEDGNDVAIEVEGAEEHEEGHDEHEEEGHEHSEEEETESSNSHCHFHAGVEHCDSDESGAEPECDASNHDYNIGLRVGLLFVILATSGFGVFMPIVVQRFIPNKLNLFFVLLKQFGTGIIISTAFIHLYTHAALMFGNPCLGNLEYEGTTSAILMAGLFLSFVVEYIGQRVVQAKNKSEAVLGLRDRSHTLLSGEVVGILVMEAGIIFHSLLIGLTLVVAGDSFFITLFVVILFHQMFEGIALGTRIAALGTRSHAHLVSSSLDQSPTLSSDGDKTGQQGETSSTSSQEVHPGFSMKKKLSLAAIFAFVTPIGMAIGIGVLQQFNGNDPSTIIAIGTLDALSAGILVWVGVVEMWAGDWMVGSHGHPAELADAPPLTVAIAGFGLVAGMMLMSFLGKWA